MTTLNSLLVGGATGWHHGGGTITYSFLGATLPSYYDRVDTDGDTVPDMIRIAPGDPSLDLPLDVDASMTVGERALAELAVAAWNEVANINLVPGSIDTGPEEGAPVTGDGTLIGGLGGGSGFGEIEVSRNDDGSSFYDISSVFDGGLNFFGTTYTGLFVNTNGNISFGSSIGTFTPFQISGGSTPIIAPFWADVDTRQDSEEESPDSAPIFIDMDTDNGVLTITWSGVGYYFQHAETTNSFQLQLFDRGGGDFDIVFRYADINWTTGDASGGSEGLGGTPARAGFSAGNGSDFFELSQSGNQGAMLGLEAIEGNTGEQGLYVFKVRNGGTVGDITFGAANFSDPNLFGFVSDFPGMLGTASVHGDLWINRSLGLQNAAAYGNTGWQTYLHELGHALGLHHPDEDPNNDAGDPRNNNQYTVMSYVVHPGQAGLGAEQQAWPITPMLFDIQAAQSLYGPNFDTRNTDTVYFAPGGAYALSDGALLPGGYGAILCVWDAGGTDLFSAANQTGDVVLNLNPGAFSTIGGIQNNIGLMTTVRIGGQIVNLIENALGGSGDDRLTGNIGANILDGGLGADIMRGNDGDDTFLVDDLGDRASEAADEGNDIVMSSVSFSLGEHIESLTLTGTAANGTGNDMANTMIGNAAANVLNGGAGGDRMRGMTGNDIYVVDDIGDRTIETADAGTDLVRSSINFTLSANLENLTLTGTAANGTGNNLINRISGNGTANVLNGAGGADIMIGGGGNDSYRVENAADKAIETAGHGVDTVTSTVSFRLGNNVENLILLGSAAIGTGNDLVNAIIGNAAANMLDGAGGADRMRGGGGNDTYRVNNAHDQAMEAAGGGVDMVKSTVSFSLGDNVENLILLGRSANGTGNDLANSIIGNAAANMLDGAGGADRMRGGGGNDVYRVDDSHDKAVEIAGAGNDVVRSSASFTLGDNVERLALIGTGAISGVGNALANGIGGNGGANTLRGEGGADMLNGGGGNDRLFGGAGKDDITGGAGDDRYFFDTGLGASNVDDLLDFSSADDTIMLDRAIFAGIQANGVLSSSAFRMGTTAQGANDRILYDAATGRIFYDADGLGGDSATLFARVDPGTALTHADFSAFT